MGRYHIAVGAARGGGQPALVNPHSSRSCQSHVSESRPEWSRDQRERLRNSEPRPPGSGCFGARPVRWLTRSAQKHIRAATEGSGGVVCEPRPKGAVVLFVSRDRRAACACRDGAATRESGSRNGQRLPIEICKSLILIGECSPLGKNCPIVAGACAANGRRVKGEGTSPCQRELRLLGYSDDLKPIPAGAFS